MNLIKLLKLKSKIDDEKKKEALKSLSKPEILDSLESTKNIVYKLDKKSYDNLMNIIKNRKNQIEKEDMVNNFVETFEKEFSRKPSIIEIYYNLDNKISQQNINSPFGLIVNPERFNAEQKSTPLAVDKELIILN